MKFITTGFYKYTRNPIYFGELFLLHPALMLVLVLITYGCNNPPCENGFLIEVPAKPRHWQSDILTPTKIQIQKGDTIFFKASGLWDVGQGSIGPDGNEDWCECAVSERSGPGFRGPVGCLIGRIGESGVPFLIGSRRTFISTADGTLYLGSNDNLGPCDGTHRGSCYDNNKGTLRVCVQVKQTDRLGANPDSIPLIAAVERADTATIKFLLDNGANVNASRFWGETALSKAVSTENIQSVKLLLERGANVNAVFVVPPPTWRYGYPTYTPLVLAIMHGNKDIVKLLLDNGADVDLVVSSRVGSGFMNKTPLMIAQDYGNAEIIGLLRKKAKK